MQASFVSLGIIAGVGVLLRHRILLLSMLTVSDLILRYPESDLITFGTHKTEPAPGKNLGEEGIRGSQSVEALTDVKGIV